jgi:hypothetical protein
MFVANVVHEPALGYRTKEDGLDRIYRLRCKVEYTDYAAR